MQTCWPESSLQRNQLSKQAMARQLQAWARLLSMLARHCPQREHPSGLMVRQTTPGGTSAGCETLKI